MLRDSKTNTVCVKKVIAFASFIVAATISFVIPNPETLVISFLSVGFGNNIINGVKEIKTDT